MLVLSYNILTSISWTIQLESLGIFIGNSLNNRSFRSMTRSRTFNVSYVRIKFNLTQV